jgi:hypothetical protein
MRKTRHSSTKKTDRPLSPWGPSLFSYETGVPGLEGERPLLRFILRVLGNHRQLIRKHLLFFLRGDFEALTPEMESAWFDLKHPEILDHAVTVMIETMRRAADLWIDSGKDPAHPNIDSPAQRNVEATLFRWINSVLFMRLPGTVQMYRDGTQRIQRNWPHFTERKLNQRGLIGSLEDYGQEFALHYFAQLLNSPDRYRIARCDHCKRYFSYERARFRPVRHGVFCSSCKDKASVKRTKSSRENRLDTAAKAWLEWDAGTQIEQRLWVADRVSEAHATTLGRRWVSQNLPKIQERVEARRNAKS